MATSSTSAEPVRLRDGTIVDLVPMRPADLQRLVRFHHTLSWETTYLRFFSVHPELSSDELYRFTHVDHRDREAIVAVADGEIVGVARFDRLDDGRDAEVAFVIADSWQGRGLGTLLFESPRRPGAPTRHRAVHRAGLYAQRSHAGGLPPRRRASDFAARRRDRARDA